MTPEQLKEHNKTDNLKRNNRNAKRKANLSQDEKAEERLQETNNRKKRRSEEKLKKPPTHLTKKRNTRNDKVTQERNKEKEAISHSLWNFTDEDLERDLAQYGDKYFKDIDSNTSKAVMLYYLNSGLFRFHQYKDYSSHSHGTTIDEDSLKEEVMAEKLTETELTSLIRNFYNTHSYTKGNLLSCGCCGIRLLEQDKLKDQAQAVQVQYQKMKLTELSVLKYEEMDEYLLQKNKQHPPIVVPANASGDQMVLHKEDFYSRYRSPLHGNYHLHPELVQQDDNGCEFVYVCPTCHSCLTGKKKKKPNPKIPPLSIAAGIDFGNYMRANLEPPNLHETVILSLNRLIFATVKISSNCSGHVNFTRNKVRFNAVLFTHDALNVAIDTLNKDEMFTVERMKDTLKLYLLGPDGRLDSLTRLAFGRHDLLARPWVLYQWINVCKAVNPEYKDVPDLSYGLLHRNVTEANDYIRENMTTINDNQTLRFETGLGSDVAKVQSDEVSDPTNKHESMLQTEPGAEPHEQFSGLPDGQNMDIETPIQYSYVTRKASTCLRDNSVLSAACLESIGNLIGLDRPSHNKQDQQQDNLRNENGDSHTETGTVSVNYKPVCDDQQDYDEDKLLGIGMDGSRRSAQSINEFCDNDDYILATTFPHIFLFGKAYGRPVGRLSIPQRNHLLRQFTLIPSQDRRLLGYMFDALKRFQAVKGVNAHVHQSNESIQVIDNLLASAEEQKTLQIAIKNPNTNLGRKVLKKYAKHVRFAGKEIAYGCMENSKLKTQVKEMCKRYGPPVSFITLSFADVDNPRSFRLSHRTVNNSAFPSIFNGQTFLTELRNNSDLTGEGVVNLPRNCTRSARAKAAINNPVAYVIESKSMINDFCSVLLGVPPENFFASADSYSRRKTGYYRANKGVLGHTLAYIGVVEDHAKGTLHYHLLFFGGLSPYLLQRFAQLPNICNAISSTLDSMYKSALPAEIHLATLVRNLVNKHPGWGLSVKDLPPVVSEPLLNRINAPEELICENVTTYQQVEHITDKEASRNQLHNHMQTCRKGFLGRTGCRFCMPFGECRCTRPVLLIETDIYSTGVTVPTEADSVNTGDSEGYDDWSDTEENDVPLVLIDQILKETSVETEPDSDDPSENDLSSTVSRAPVGSVASSKDAGELNNLFHNLYPSSALETDESKIFPFRVVHDVGKVKNCEQLSCHTTHSILDRDATSDVIVWETARPNIDSITEAHLSPRVAENGKDVILNRQQVLKSLHDALLPIPGYDDNSHIWPWLEQLPDENLFTFYDSLISQLEKANGFVSSYNPVTSYCTGSHNNFSLLGSLIQAKGAVFYVCPYMGKSKYPLQQCLTLLQQSLDHVQDYPSIAADSGTKIRTVKHILQRLLNKMNLHMELSDYQIAADLIGLPSIIASDRFAYGNPAADMAYRTHVQMRESGALDELLYQANRERDDFEYRRAVGPGGELEDFVEMEGKNEENQPTEHASDTTSRVTQAATTSSYYKDDVLAEIGHLKVYPFEESCPDGTSLKYKTLVPTSAYYGNRGQELKHLSRHEYRALIGVDKKKGTSPRRQSGAGRPRSPGFEFADKFVLSSQYAQFLLSKQRTPILARQAPNHPGREPSQVKTKEHKAWKDKADKYARFFLTEYRPEPVCFLPEHRNPYKYDWKALQEWISDCQKDGSIISKFRIMAMHTRMQGWKTQFRTKVMVNKYRARRRDRWTESEKRQFAYEDSMRRKQEEHDRGIIDEYTFSEQYATLPNRTNRQMIIQIDDDSKQHGSYCKILERGSYRPCFVVKSVGVSYDKSFEVVRRLGLCLRKAKIFEPEDIETSLRENDTSSNLNDKSWRFLRNLTLNRSQKEIFDLYRAYLEDPEDESKKPPQITLLHGAAGTGKSSVTHAIIGIAEKLRRKTVRTAFNSINALAIGGNTTASIIKLRPGVHCNEFVQLTLDDVQDLQGYLGEARLLIVDEVSTQAPFHLAQLSYACQQCLEVYDKPFGGIPVLLVGDLNQLGPVKAGLSLTQAIMAICQWRQTLSSPQV